MFRITSLINQYKLYKFRNWNLFQEIEKNRNNNGRRKEKKESIKY